MKKRPKELDVDYIGGQKNPPTQEEQLTITAFLKKLKEKRNRTTKSKSSKLGNQPA